MFNKMNNILKVFLIFFIIINFTGCAYVIDYYVSHPENEEKKYKFWPEVGIVVIDLMDVVIYVEPDNSISAADGGMLLLPIPIMDPRKEITEKYRKGTYLFKDDASSIADVLEGNYFYVEILIRTKKDGFSFNPKEVYLELENGKYLQASRYLKPDVKLEEPYKVVKYRLLNIPDCFLRKEKNEQFLDKYFPILAKEYVGFAIRFETLVPNPGTPFNLEIKGLKYFDQPVTIPKIKYKDKKLYRNYITT